MWLSMDVFYLPINLLAALKIIYNDDNNIKSCLIGKVNCIERAMESMLPITL